MERIITNFKTNIFCFILLAFGISYVAKADNIEFFNEKNDTIEITRILEEECRSENPGDVLRIAKLFLGKPYKEGTLEGISEKELPYPDEVLRVNIGQLDCTTFVENVLALAYTARQNRHSWRDFAENLKSMRYHNGEIDGYASRLHYLSEWIVENTWRGKIKELTTEITGATHVVKTLDFMTRNANLYPALADSSNYAQMKQAESKLSNLRFPVLKYGNVKNRRLLGIVKDGNVVLFTTSKSGLDVTHMGFIVIENGIVKLLHASQKGGKVMIDDLSVEDYVRRFRAEGIRVIRLEN